MKKLLIAALLALLPGVALAQSVVQQPQFVAPRAVLDMGNGPLEIQLINGNAGFFTSSGSGVGSGTTTAITLTATPTTPPCVGCLISGGGIAAGAIVTAYNGTTGITTSTSQTVASSSALSWGAACPAAPPPQSSVLALLQAGIQPAQTGAPFYTEARLCAYGAAGPGAQFLSFPFGAH